MTDTPTITADITFLTGEEGGRKSLPMVWSTGEYRPHIVIQSPDVREVLLDSNGVCREAYLGVQFVSGPTPPRAGESSQFELRLVYHPRVNYDAVVPGATFTVREGGHVVGFGRVMG